MFTLKKQLYNRLHNTNPKDRKWILFAIGGFAVGVIHGRLTSKKLDESQLTEFRGQDEHIY